MKNKIAVVILCAMLLALGSSADAQQPAKIPRIGVLSTAGDSRIPGFQIEAFRKGLLDIGYIDGKNVLVDYRYAEGNQDRLPSIVAELVQLKVDVLVVTALTALRVAKQATQTIPTVMVILSDPVATGIVDSLARPGGNITGFTRLSRELSGKRLELLKETVPKISRAAVLWDGNAPGSAAALKEYQAASYALKMHIEPLEVRGPDPDLETTIQGAARPTLGALITINNALVRRYSKRIADLTIKKKLPSMFEGRDYIEAGGLMSYSANDTEAYSRAAIYVDKILKGKKPADLPIEQPTKFEFVINLKTAKQIGLTIPPNVLARADRVIK
jgi:putative ABC transport system substrate-binding protein